MPGKFAVAATTASSIAGFAFFAYAHAAPGGAASRDFTHEDSFIHEAPVAEPGTGAMMFAGLIGVGAIARRRLLG